MARAPVSFRSSAIRLVILIPFIFLLKERWTSYTAPGHDASVQTSASSQRRLLQQVDLVNSTFPPSTAVGGTLDASSGSCSDVLQHAGYANQCEYVKNRSGCLSGTLVEYLQYYYCSSAKFHVLGIVILVLWILSLFYALGNTAADYFCPSLEELSELLNLPPTVAGVTLLPLGNGAPDVFASHCYCDMRLAQTVSLLVTALACSIAAFIGAGEGQVGLNSVLGSGAFVSMVVAGAVSLVVAGIPNSGPVDRNSFFRDVGFYLITLLALLVITLSTQIHLLWALGFLSIYIFYGCAILVSEIHRSRPRPTGILLQALGEGGGGEEEGWVYEPLLGPDEVGGGGSGNFEAPHSLPQWMWSSNVAIYSRTGAGSGKGGVGEGKVRPLWGWSEEEEEEGPPKFWSWKGAWLYLVDFPIMLPRRITIPSRQQQGWSRPYAILSATFAPLLLGSIFVPSVLAWNFLLYFGGAGALFGVAAFFATDDSGPPKRFALPWVLGGFVMSVVWFYVIANELVASLVAVGVILNIDSSLLGLTVLAWGNSIGDMVANLAMAVNGGSDGAQIAWSGCYAGPMFNALVGIGSSLVIASWKSYPAMFDVPKDPTLPYTILFLVAGLVYSLLVLPYNGMKFTRTLGVGLIGLYLTFMGLRVLHLVGVVALPAWT